MSATRGFNALDADPNRLVQYSEIDAAKLANAYHLLAGVNQYTDADKAAVQELAKFKGEHATAAALEAAHPGATQQTDAFAMVEATDTIWVIDSDVNPTVWVDSGAQTVPSSVDTALSLLGTGPVSNAAISTAMQARLTEKVIAIPGDNAQTTFTVTHTMLSVTRGFVRLAASSEEIGLSVVPASATTMTVGPFETAPPDATTFELVLIGTLAI